MVWFVNRLRENILTDVFPFEYVFLIVFFVFPCDCKHQLDSVFLVNFCCTGVVVDRYNIRLWMHSLDASDHTFTCDMVWEEIDQKHKEKLQRNVVLAAPMYRNAINVNDVREVLWCMELYIL